MIYVIVGVVVLIISFILAFVSLVKEHKKLEEETLVDVPEDSSDAGVLEQPVDLGVDKENIYRRLEELTKNQSGSEADLPDAQNVTDKVERKDFPWEVEGKSQLFGSEQTEQSTLGDEKVGQVNSSWKEELGESEGQISGTISLSSARKKTQD